MYKLIFADDEAIVRNNISRMINWQEYGFTLAAVCSNGHDLVEIAERIQPDLIIADINMPYIDGITAAKMIKEELPYIKIVFLTGYNSFTYAQKAIDLNVLRYILKPVTAESMKTSLAEIRGILDEEARAKADYRRLEAFYDLNREMLQNTFCNMLLDGSLFEKETVSRAKSLGLEWLIGVPCLSAVFSDDGVRLTEKNGSSAVDMLNYGIYNIVKEKLGNFGLGTAIIKNDKIVALLAKDAGKDEAASLTQYALVCLEQIRLTIQESLNISLSVGVGRQYPAMDELFHSYNEAISALAYRHSLAGGQVIYIDDIEPNRHTLQIFDKARELQLIDAVKHGEKKQVEAIVDDLLLNASQGNAYSLRIYALSMLISLASEAESLGLTIDLFKMPGKLEVFFQKKGERELRDTVLYACLALLDQISGHRQTNCSSAVEKALHYIEQHYANPELSVEEVCQELHLSSSYFRALFKKEMSAPFGNYVTRVRMEKAKALLLSTDKKNYEIAEKVGYSDPHYFSFCFKKYYGASPNEMRERKETSI